MKRNFISIIFFLMFSSTVLAAPKTVELSVPGMNCASCPITVKKSLHKLDGVTKTVVNLDERIALVTFDDAKTNIQALIRATTDAGYPSVLK